MPISDYLRDLRAKVGTALLHVPSVTALVFDAERRVLLVRHSNGGVWVTPGGAIDPDEAPEDAVVREVWEETGLRVEPVHLCGVYGGPGFRVTYANGDLTSYVMAAFECRRLGGELRVDDDEVTEARWVAADDFATVELSAWAKVVLPPLVGAGAGATWIPTVRWRPPAE
jgi:8-oxo-dGTP pyrophosphatase MutT (NUDIX family)